MTEEEKEKRRESIGRMQKNRKKTKEQEED